MVSLLWFSGKHSDGRIKNFLGTRWLARRLGIVGKKARNHESVDLLLSETCTVYRPFKLFRTCILAARAHVNNSATHNCHWTLRCLVESIVISTKRELRLLECLWKVRFFEILHLIFPISSSSSSSSSFFFSISENWKF